jgi:hypothetical protein
MELRVFLLSLPYASREDFAARCDTTFGHLRNVAGGYKPCSPLLATALEIESAGRVRRWDMRPQDWHRIWPELVDSPGAPPVAAPSEH